jgi:hypothetical protein
MKLRVGNGCWHAGHVRAAAICLEAGFFAQEGLDVEVVHAKINPKGLESSRPDGERYERGFTKIYDFVEDTKPHGRPDRVTVARKGFIKRNPELVKRYWKASIRGYQFMRIVPDHFAFQRFVEAKLRVGNPDESERVRDLLSPALMASYFVPLDGQLSAEGVWRILEEHQDAGMLARSITRADVEELVRQELVQEAWAEVSQTDEVKRNLEQLQPVVERLGY